MSYIVKYRGLEITCGSLDDVDALADRLSVSATPGAPAETQPYLSKPAAVANVIAGLKPNQKRFLQILIDAHGSVGDEVVKEKLGLSDNRSIGGLQTGLIKNFKKTGLKKIIQREARRNGSGERHYNYCLTRSFLDALKVPGAMKGHEQE